MGKGFAEFVAAEDADIFCIQESKLQEGQIDLDLSGYHQYWNYADKKGYTEILRELDARGAITSAVTITVNSASKAAVEAIEKAGGKVNII